MPSGSSPMLSKRLPSSFRPSPASIRIRTLSVLMNVALPLLPLPRTESVTIAENYGDGRGQLRGIRVFPYHRNAKQHVPGFTDVEITELVGATKLSRRILIPLCECRPGLVRTTRKNESPE